jgi:hypothetical protein
MDFIQTPPTSRILDYCRPLPYHLQQLVSGNLPFAECSEVRE